MDIIRHCAAQPHVRARALLRSHGLSRRQIDHFLVLACARLIRTYITRRHEFCAHMAGEPDINTLLHGMHLPTLAARVKLDITLTTLVVRELIPCVVMQLHSTLGNERSLMTLLDRHDAA